MRSSIITVVNGTASNRANDLGCAAQLLRALVAFGLRSGGFTLPPPCGRGALLSKIRVRSNLFFLLFAALFFFATLAGAESTNGPAERQSNRFLIVIETSRSMKRRLPGTEAALKTLLDSSLGGELRPGDTLGLWTFNEELTKGKFPLQHWSAESQPSITALVLNSVRAQKFEKTARLASVMPSLNALAEASEELTVILFTDGTANFWGTPFDEAINKVFQEWREEEQRSRLPFVTVLRARGGKFVNFALAPAPWPVVIPPFKTEKPVSSPPIVPVAGIKPSASPTPLRLPVERPRTNLPIKVMPPITAARTTVVPTNLNPLIWETNFQQKLFPEPPTLVFPSSSPALMVVGGSPGTTLATNQSPPASLAVAPPTQTISEPPTNLTASAPHPNATLPVSALIPPSDTNPAPVAAPPIAPSAPALTNEVALTRPAADTTDDTGVAPSWFSRPAVQVTGFLLLAVVFGLAVFFLRRSRAAPHISLITRSIGPKK